MKRIFSALASAGLMAVVLVAAVGRPASAQQRYAFTDLGLGNMPRSVNNYGQVVGQGGFLWTPTTAAGTAGSITRLTATIPFANPYSINVSGQVVGIYSTTDSTGATVSSPFLWTPTAPNGTTGTWIDLNRTVPAGWVLTTASCINDSCLIVGAGHYTDPGTMVTTYGQYGWSQDALHRVTITLIPVHSPGYVDTLNNVSPPQVSVEFYTWQSGVTTPMGQVSALLNSSTQGRGINDLGQVAGQFQSSLTRSSHAFLWTPDVPNGAVSTRGIQDLMPVGFFQSNARGINNIGQVIGAGWPTQTSFQYAALWDTDSAGNYHYQSLADLTALPAAWPLAISPLRQACAINNRVAVLLNSSGVSVPAAQITGWGLFVVTATTIVHGKPVTTTNSETHGFLLTPQ